MLGYMKCVKDGDKFKPKALSLGASAARWNRGASWFRRYLELEKKEPRMTLREDLRLSCAFLA